MRRILRSSATPPTGTTDPPAPAPAGVTRRALLGGAAAGAAALGVGATSSYAWARALAADAGATPAAPAGPGRLVVVFLRGGMDGLSAVVPAGDAAYHDARPTVAIPADAVLPLDGRFGLHPALGPLHGLYGDGRLAVVHAVGNPAGSRSHFDAQDLMEQGDAARRADARGWAARHLATAGRTGLFDAVALSANVPGSLRGAHALAIPTVEGFGLGGRSGLTGDYETSLRFAYYGEAPIEVTGTATLDAIDRVGNIAPTGGSGAFADAAALLGAGLGTELVTIDLGGWDTHDGMGTHDEGTMAGLLAGLGADLAEFQTTLDTTGQGDVTTVVMSEFGRRVAENGSGGLDHGWGGVMLLMGGAVRGGRVLTDWPGLAPGDLERGDLRVTTDFRDVLWELVASVLGNPDTAAVFPGHTHVPVGLLA